MTDKLTPAQECAVEVINSKLSIRKPGWSGDLTEEEIRAECPVSYEFFTAIISRFIREAEQRGREEAAEETKIVRDAGQFLLKECESWIHDQLDGTGFVEDKLAELNQARLTLSTPEAPHD